ncbi:MAG: heme-copper oxidase subunit III [Deltaproteobacteria bacterium]|nr:heme-copper oxidase subunit III [Deltaproteobacteria bacterium]
MARQATLRRRVEQAPSEPKKAPVFGGGEPPAPPSSHAAPIISNARLGLLMFLAAEAMFFSGLIGAFLVFRLGNPVWPPPFQPRLPLAVTGINTVILLASGLTMRLALKRVRAGSQGGLKLHLVTTAGLGVIFLGIQGYEWARLLHFGLTISSGIYGATFYTLIGTHALHVLGAVLWLGVILFQALQRRFTNTSYAGVELCAMYWTFVVGLWPLLYGLVYFR